MHHPPRRHPVAPDKRPAVSYPGPRRPDESRKHAGNSRSGRAGRTCPRGGSWPWSSSSRPSPSSSCPRWACPRRQHWRPRASPQTMRWNRLGGLVASPSAATSRTHSWGPPVSSVAPMRSESAHVTWR
ncbi:hypothetical protein HMPREF9057_02024 [Actinomyces sp. oral taxon 171 str. F0337]|nr:hypothetical protein HMPREF9057_02024 [Actinomyces sp. oral taxon 171 str. F0337]